MGGWAKIAEKIIKIITYPIGLSIGKEAIAYKDLTTTIKRKLFVTINKENSSGADRFKY